MRDLQFITPVKAKIGPPQAMCHQTQRFQVGRLERRGCGSEMQHGLQWVAAHALHVCVRSGDP